MACRHRADLDRLCALSALPGDRAVRGRHRLRDRDRKRGSAPAGAPRYRCSRRRCSGWSRSERRCSIWFGRRSCFARRARRRRPRHRALQRGAVGAGCRAADPQPGASPRPSQTERHRSASAAQNQSACQLAKSSLPAIASAAQHEHRPRPPFPPAGRAPCGARHQEREQQERHRGRRSAAQTENRGSADRRRARARTARQERTARTTSHPERDAQPALARARPSGRSAGQTPAVATFAASAAAPAIGAAIASEANASERSPAADAEAFERHVLDRPADQHAGAQPRFSAIAIQRPSVGSGARRRVAPRSKRRGEHQAPRSATPPAACQRQCGWFDTGAPQANFCVRGGSSNRPQWPPTVPS